MDTMLKILIIKMVSELLSKPFTHQNKKAHITLFRLLKLKANQRILIDSFKQDQDYKKQVGYLQKTIMTLS